MIRTLDQERFKPVSGLCRTTAHPESIQLEKTVSTHNGVVKIRVSLARNTMHQKAIERR